MTMFCMTRITCYSIEIDEYSQDPYMPTPAKTTVRSSRPMWINWLISIFIWTTVGLFIASQNVTSRPFVSKEEISWGVALVHVAIWSYFWSIVTFFIFSVVRNNPLDKSGRYRAIAIHTGLALCCHILLSAIFIIFEFIVNPEESKVDGALLVFAKILLVMLVTDLLTYFCIAAVGQTVDFYKKLREREVKATRLETELITAQLNQLRSQLHPHFLFNTLSAITTLIYENREAAEKMVVRLSELLRMALEQPETQTRTLREELAFVHKYIEIESIRFGNRLEYCEEIENQSLNARVPFLILQPLVENSLKHAVEHCRNSCQVQLAVNVVDDRLQMTLRDSGPDSNGNARNSGNGHANGGGIGLSNTRTRLEHLYPENHTIRIDQLDPGFRVQIEVPYESEKDS